MHDVEVAVLPRLAADLTPVRCISGRKGAGWLPAGWFPGAGFLAWTEACLRALWRLARGRRSSRGWAPERGAVGARGLL